MAFSRALIAFFLVAFAGLCHAQIAPVTQQQWSCGGQPGHGGWHNTTEAAIAAMKAANPGSYGDPSYLSGTGCYAYIEYWASVMLIMPAYSRSESTCPANSTLSGSSCTCNSGYVQQGNACVVYQSPEEAYCQQTAGSPVKQAWRSTSMALTQGKTMCATGGFYNCSATVNTDYCGQSPDGSIICEGSGVASATPCTPSPDPQQPSSPTETGTPFPDPPPPGTCPGTVNGIAVNVPCSSTNTSNTKTTQSTDGAGNTTSKTESKATTCNAAGSCTTTVTTTTTVNGGSPTTTTNTTTEGKGQFCASNPGSSECGDGTGSTFGGNCQASFQCTGDAVQCATAKAVNDQLCKLKDVFEMDSETQGLVNSVLAGTWTENPADNPEVISVGVFDQTNSLGSTCPGDVSFSLGGRTMTVPLSQGCTWLQLIGNMLVAMSLLGATLFVLRRGD